MPPLLTPSPTILDQSFPRNIEELTEVGIALGELEECFSNGDVQLLLTNVLAEWALEYDWAPPENCHALHQIYIFINQLFLSPQEGLVRLNLDGFDVEGSKSHPLPKDCSTSGWIEIWADEMGKVFDLHKLLSPESFFIGIACEKGFSGNTSQEYTGDAEEGFPLIGPSRIQQLEDAYQWVTPHDVLRRQVSYGAAEKNVKLLGATKVVPSRSGGSHRSVKFPGARSWVLDTNLDPLPYDYVKELVPIVNLPLDVIFYVLIYSEYPNRVIKIPQEYLVQ